MNSEKVSIFFYYICHIQIYQRNFIENNFNIFKIMISSSLLFRLILSLIFNATIRFGFGRILFKNIRYSIGIYLKRKPISR